MNPPFFSIVIPACDVARYIGDAVQSLKRQSFADFEALIVCEESADGTLGAAEAAVAGDSRFTIAPLPRSGSASVSRNYGTRETRGRYLVFLDGDDWLEDGALETVAGKLGETGDVDMLMLDATVYYDGGGGAVARREGISDGAPEGRIFSGVELLSRILRPEAIEQATWMRVYSREFLLEKELFQIPGRRHQDTEWTPRVFFRADRIAALHYSYYCYRKRPGSVTTRPTPQGIRDEALNTGSLFRFFLENEFPPELRRRYATFFADFLNIFFAFFKRKSFSRRDRAEAFRLLFPDAGARLDYLKIVRYARFGKKLMVPWVALAWLPGGFVAAEWGFRFCYYPLIDSLWGRFGGKK